MRRAWYCVSASGHYPVGFAAVMVAETAIMARECLEQELKADGLEGKNSGKDRLRLGEIILLDMSKDSAEILVNGDY